MPLTVLECNLFSTIEKNSHLFSGVLQLNISSLCLLEFILTMNKNYNCHSTLCPDVDRQESDRTFTHAGKPITLK